jgi:hypothetical protein
MKNIKKILTFIIFPLILFSCNNNHNNTQGELLYRGQRWDVVKLNDSVYALIPGMNTDKKLEPIIINVNKIQK